MTTLYLSEGASSKEPCTVKFDGNSILVEYGDEHLQYKGWAEQEGHFKLEAIGFDGAATLHMFKGEATLEGSWREGGKRGMWIIELE